TEGNRFQRQKRFAGPLHWLNFLFKAPGGCSRSEFAVSINEHGSSARRRRAKNASDKGGVVRVDSPDTNRTRVAEYAPITNFDILKALEDACTSRIPQGDVA